MKEKDIVHENGPYWVWKKSDSEFHAMVSGITHSISDSAYSDVSLAIARVDYFARTHNEPNKNLKRFQALERSARIMI